MADQPVTPEQDATGVPQDKVRFYCPKHGDITNATLHLSFADSEGNKQGEYLYCLHCLNEVLLSLQKSGAIETVQIVVPEELKNQAAAEESQENTTPDAASLIEQMTQPSAD